MAKTSDVYSMLPARPAPQTLLADGVQHLCGGGVVQLTHYVNGHSAGVPIHDDLVNAWIATSVRMTACRPVPSSAPGWHTDSGVSTF
jgi:hypothetical protein